MPFDKAAPVDPVYRTAQHRRARKRLITAFTEGDPCCLCTHPMHGPTRRLHADHCPECIGAGCDQCDGVGYRGLAHGYPCEDCGKSCNQHDGAVRGRARQTEGAARWVL